MTKRTLIKGGSVVTMDATLGELLQGDVLVEGKKIVAVKDRIDEPADEVVDAKGMIVMPGLIDTHIHLWQLPLRNFSHLYHHSTQYFSHAYPRRIVFGPEDVYGGVYAGALELISNGTTTVLDFCHCVNSLPHGESAVAGLRDSGIRGVHGHSISRPPKLGHSHEDKLADAERVRSDVVGNDSDGLLSMMLALSERQMGAEMEEYRREFDFARKRGMRITGHAIQELQVTALNKANLLGSDLLLVHATQMTRQELDLLKKNDMSISFTPSVEFKRDSCAMLGWAIERNIQLTWGVDVPTYVDPDLFSQMRIVMTMQLHKDALEDSSSHMSHRRVPTLSAEQTLYAGTLGGAKALGLDDRIGSLTPGKEADIVILDQPFAGTTAGSLASHIIFQSGSRDVDAVMIAGKFRKRGRQMLDVDRDHVRKLVADVQTRVMAQPFTPHFEWSMPPADWRPYV